MRIARAALAGAFVATACARQSAPAAGETSASAATCLALTDSLPADTDIHTIAGSFRLQLVGTGGAASGRHVSGRLDLPAASHDSLMGTATIALDSVGAAAPGPRPRDNQYLVTALKWRATATGRPNITIRFGGLAAPAGTQVIEGAHMALAVSSIWNGGLRGTWSSGTGDPMIPGAAGHFCAERVR
jgi:hypothetical protein